MDWRLELSRHAKEANEPSQSSGKTQIKCHIQVAHANIQVINFFLSSFYFSIRRSKMVKDKLNNVHLSLFIHSYWFIYPCVFFLLQANMPSSHAISSHEFKTRMNSLGLNVMGRYCFIRSYRWLLFCKIEIMFEEGGGGK